MNIDEAMAVLVTAFRALSDKQRARLLMHAQKKTPICCGERAVEFLDPSDGAG